MRHVTFYHAKTGLLHGQSVMVSDDSAVALNTPPDHEAIDHPLGGMLDSLSQRVDIETGEIVDYQPPSPSADHEWNSGSRRWVLTEHAQQKQKQKRDAYLRKRDLESQQHGHVRALILDPDDRQARASLDAIHTEITALGVYL